MTLKTRALGRTGLQLTEPGFGGAAMATLFAPVAPESAIATLQTASEGGMRHFDTAPFYGHGRSERRTGDFLQWQDATPLCCPPKSESCCARCHAGHPQECPAEMRCCGKARLLRGAGQVCQVAGRDFPR